MDIQAYLHQAYLIMPDRDHLILSRREREGRGEWKNLYRFTLESHAYPDYAPMCHYHQTSPESHFTRGRVSTRATPEGRITLSELRFITTIRGGGRHERLLSGEDEHALILDQHFGIRLTPSSR